MKSKTKFKQTEIGKIPEDWEIKELSNICEKIIDCSHAKKPDFLDNGDYIFLEVSNIGNDGFLNLEEKKFVSKEDYDGWTKRLIPQENDIIITKTGRVGASSIIPAKIKCCIGRNQVILRANSKIVKPHFLWHFLRSSIYKNELKKQTMTGTILESLHVKYIPKIKIALPKINEQKKIVSFLDAISYKIKLLQKQNKTLEEIGQAIFKHWFVDFEFPNEEGKPYKSSGGKIVYNEELGKEIPEGWTVSKIGDELTVELGGTPDRKKEDYWNGNINWINSGKINEFRIIEPSERITKEGLENSATKLLPKGTVVIAITGATLGQVSRIEIDTCANQSVIGIIEGDNLPSEYLYFWTKKMIKDLICWQTGGAQQHINKSNVQNAYILIPPKKLINNYFEISKDILSKISNNCFESKSLTNIRDSLLPRLMSGRIRVPIKAK